MTDATSHTPGPWTRKHTTISAPRGWRSHASKKTIATVRPYPNTEEAYQEGIANARLIEAAPDLLEQTRLLERTLVYEIKKSDREGDDEGARLKSLTLAVCRAALAKAGVKP